MSQLAWPTATSLNHRFAPDGSRSDREPTTSLLTHYKPGRAKMLTPRENTVRLSR
jgi:hypothetical protein